jgi:hypothetical protein
MDIVVNGVHTLCTTHQELINAKTELAGANAELEKKAAAAADTPALLGDRVRTLCSELKKTLPTEVNTTYLWVSLCVHVAVYVMLPHTWQHQHMLLPRCCYALDISCTLQVRQKAIFWSSWTLWCMVSVKCAPHTKSLLRELLPQHAMPKQFLIVLRAQLSDLSLYLLRTQLRKRVP